MRELNSIEQEIVKVLQGDGNGKPYPWCGEIFYDYCGNVPVSHMAAMISLRLLTDDVEGERV